MLFKIEERNFTFVNSDIEIHYIKANINTLLKEKRQTQKNDWSLKRHGIRFTERIGKRIIIDNFTG